MTLKASFKKMAQSAAAAALAGVVLWSCATPADAASVCARLRDRLNSATETIGNTAETRAYARAIARQNQEILKVRDNIHRYGCSSGSIVVIGGRNANICNTLTDALGRMQANVKSLMDHKASLISRSLSRESRRRILSALDANGCNDIQSDQAETTTLNPPPVNASYSQTQPESQEVHETYQIQNLGGVSQSGGGLQTVCVRTCDGGYFPISSNVSTASFARDAQVCSMMCPGVSTQLFYHSLGSQDSSDMISIASGKAYEDQPYAYKYKTSRPSSNKSCSCNFSAYYREMMSRETGKVTATKPPARESSIEYFGTALDLRKTAAKPITIKKQPARPYDPSKQHVRQVGPAFLPTHNEIVNLHDPDEKGQD